MGRIYTWSCVRSYICKGMLSWRWNRTEVKASKSRYRCTKSRTKRPLNSLLTSFLSRNPSRVASSKSLCIHRFLLLAKRSLLRAFQALQGLRRGTNRAWYCWDKRVQASTLWQHILSRSTFSSRRMPGKLRMLPIFSQDRRQSYPRTFRACVWQQTLHLRCPPLQ